MLPAEECLGGNVKPTTAGTTRGRRFSHHVPSCWSSRDNGEVKMTRQRDIKMSDYSQNLVYTPSQIKSFDVNLI